MKCKTARCQALWLKSLQFSRNESDPAHRIPRAVEVPRPPATLHPLQSISHKPNQGGGSTEALISILSFYHHHYPHLISSLANFPVYCSNSILLVVGGITVGSDNSSTCIASSFIFSMDSLCLCQLQVTAAHQRMLLFHSILLQTNRFISSLVNWKGQAAWIQSKEGPGLVTSFRYIDAGGTSSMLFHKTAQM